MFFKRVLHPVGQGAFFTEQLWEDNEESAFFNVVYDCGSNTGLKKGVPQPVAKEIRNTYEENKKIDLLFISHFDEDHTNGLESLVKQGLITKDTKVIIPFRYPYLLMVTENDYTSLARFVMQAYNIGATLIGINVGNNENRNLRDVDVDLLSKGQSLHNGTIIYKKDGKGIIWYYYPFMLSKQQPLMEVFVEKINDAKADGKDIDINDLEDPEIVIEKRSLLREIYQEIGKTKGGVTKINVNSLLMLSFPAKNIFKRACLWHMAQHYCWVGPACFYTGDSNLQGNDYDDAVKSARDAIDKYSKGTRVGLMQVPHHGSRRCYSFQMADRNGEFAEFAFVNCNPLHSQKIFDSNIIGDFIRNCKELLLVTDNYHSRVEVIAEI